MVSPLIHHYFWIYLWCIQHNVDKNVCIYKTYCYCIVTKKSFLKCGSLIIFLKSCVTSISAYGNKERMKNEKKTKKNKTTKIQSTAASCFSKYSVCIGILHQHETPNAATRHCKENKMIIFPCKMYLHPRSLIVIAVTDFTLVNFGLSGQKRLLRKFSLISPWLGYASSLEQTEIPIFKDINILMLCIKFG